MTFKILVLLHILSATIWTGGHLVLAIIVLPKALKKKRIRINRKLWTKLWDTRACHQL